MTIVLDYPTQLEIRKGRLLEGDTGRIVKATLRALGVEWDAFNVISALNCKPNSAKPKQLREAMGCCRARLLRELRALNTEKILCLGPISLTALTSTDRISRMDKVHGRWMPVYGMQLLGTYSPTRILIDPEFYRDFYFDVEKFLNTDGRESWPDIRVYTPRTVKQLYKYMHQIGAFDSTVQLSCDIETNGFNPVENEILAIGFASMRDGTAGDVVILDRAMLERYETWWTIADQLEFGLTAFHNAKFDLQFLIREMRKLGISYRLNNIDDTMLLNYCRDERPIGRFGAHSLKNISRVRYDAPDYDIGMGKWIKEYQKAIAENDYERHDQLVDQMHRYLALDCYYTVRLAGELRQEVADESDRLLDFYEWLLIPGAIALAEIELHGCKLNRPYLERLDRKLERQADDLLKQIRKAVGNPDFNPGSAKQMYDLLYKQLALPITKTERRGKLREGPTSQPVMRILRGKYPEHRELLDLIIAWRRSMKTRGTYVTGLLDRLDSDDRIRGNFNINGTSTGRLSSSDPNLQNIPEKSHIGFDVRAAFIPSHRDWVMIEADYSQLELRVAAFLSEDKNFTAAYVEDRDLHKDATDAIYQREEVTPYERWLAKCMVFGALYGRGARSLAYGPEMEYMENELGGTRWTLAQTEEFFQRFFNQYPQLREWQRDQRELVYREGLVETPLGRLRRFPFISRKDDGAAGRQAMNTPIQSTASDITFSALVRIHRRLAELNDQTGKIVAHIVLTVHDSITTECHPRYLKKVVKIIDEEMKRVPIKSRVPFKAKIETGKNWSSCK